MKSPIGETEAVHTRSVWRVIDLLSHVAIGLSIVSFLLVSPATALLLLAASVAVVLLASRVRRRRF